MNITSGRLSPLPIKHHLPYGQFNRLTSHPRRRRHLITVLSRVFFVLLLVLGPAAAHAQDGVWNNPPAGGDASGNWGTASLWNNGVIANGSGSTANFATLDLTADSTIHLDTPRTVSNLLFGDAVADTAAGWTLDNLGDSNNVLTLAANASGSAPTITVNTLGTGKSVTISAGLAGSSGLVKDGAGTLVLTGDNAYTGGTTVLAGAITASNVALGGVGESVTFQGGGIRLNGNAATFNRPTIVNSAGTLTFGTGSNGFNSILVGNGALTIAQGNGTSNTVTFGLGAAAGSVDFSSYSGTLTLNNKFFRFDAGYNAGSGRNAVWQLGAGATLNYRNGTNATITFELGALSSSSTAAVLSGGAGNGTGTIRYQIGSLGVDTAFAGTITDGLTKTALTKVGGGTLNLTGANTFSLGLIVSAGTLRAGADGALGNGNVTINAGGQLTLANGATNNYLNDAASLSLTGAPGANGVVNLNFIGADAISSLVLNNVVQLPGTYNATTNPDYFTGTGSLVVTPVPEPGAVGIGLAGLGLAAGWRRLRSARRK